MDIMQAAAGLRQHLEAFAASAAEKIEQELPAIDSMAQQLAVNPAMAALANAVHLPEFPEYMQALADQIAAIDTAIGAAKAKAVAEAQQPEAPAEPAQPA